MKPKSDLDPDFATAQRFRRTRGRTRWLLAVAAVAAVLALILARQTGSQPASVPSATPVLTGEHARVLQPAPDQPEPGTRPQAPDHFIVMASPSIDPGMVQRAPSGLDDAMVVPTPEALATPPFVVVPQPGPPVYPPVPIPPNPGTPQEKVAPNASQRVPVPAPAEPR